MEKRNNTIILSGIILAFIAGTFVSGTQVFGAAQSGWQAAFDDLINGITAVDLNPASTIGGSPISTGEHTTDTNTNTNAETICDAGQFLDGDGTCDPNLGFEKKSKRVHASGGTAFVSIDCPAGKVIFGEDFVGSHKPTTSIDESFALDEDTWKITISFGPEDDFMVSIICIDNPT